MFIVNENLNLRFAVFIQWMCKDDKSNKEQMRLSAFNDIVVGNYSMGVYTHTSWLSYSYE